MKKIHISTISLSSRTNGDLQRQIDWLMNDTKKGDFEYEIGKYYEVSPGYIGVDILVYLPYDKVEEFKAMEDFNKEDRGDGTIH